MMDFKYEYNSKLQDLIHPVFMKPENNRNHRNQFYQRLSQN